jgi:hypothetical protein
MAKKAKAKTAKPKSAKAKSAKTKTAKPKSAKTKSAKAKSAKVKTAKVKTAKVKTAKRKKAQQATAANQPLVITLTGDRPIHEVAGDLKAAGLAVDQVLTSTGIVTGSAHPDAATRLRNVRGVADVSPDHPVDIGPPGSPIS